MNAPATADVFLFDGFRLERRGLFRRDQNGVFVPLAMGSRALDILGLLVERPGDLVSRVEIISAVWPETAVEESNLNVQIAALRRVLDEGRADGSCSWRSRTIRASRSYRFTHGVTRASVEAGLSMRKRPPALRTEPSST